ncbi:unnamed protein product, partial [Diamesa serratosioi]
DDDLDKEMSLLDSTYDELLKSPDGSTKSNSPAVPVRKVSLKRNISDVISSLKSSKPKATSSSDSQNDNKKKNIKLSEFTSHNQQSRIEMRIKKFGATTTNRKEARAVRFGNTAIKSTPKNNNISSVASVVALEVLKKRAERFGTVTALAGKSSQLNEKLKERQERFGS